MKPLREIHIISGLELWFIYICFEDCKSFLTFSPVSSLPSALIGYAPGPQKESFYYPAETRGNGE